MTSRTRLMKELKEVAKDTDPTISLAPDGENLLRWTATLQGPLETPFESGTFTVSFIVPEVGGCTAVRMQWTQLEGA
jgi:ubiquitin-protein ligase